MTPADRPAAESKTKGSGLVLVFLLLWTLAGCSAAKKTADTVVETSSDVVDWVLPMGRAGPRQTVALIGVESSLPSVQAGFADHFRQALPGFLKKDCSEAVIDEAEAVKTPPRLPSGLLDGYALAVLGRPRGVNFFLIGTLVECGQGRTQGLLAVEGHPLLHSDRRTARTRRFRDRGQDPG
jgi:hypothetical protein